MKQDFSRRSTQSELMDADDTDYATFQGCLHDLAQVNLVTLAYRPTLAFLERLRRQNRFAPGRPVRIVDVGSGYGDMLRLIDRWGARHGLTLELTGVDLNPWSARSAAQATPAGRPIHWLTQDVFDYQGGADVVLSSLFTHHLDDGQVQRFLAWMDRTAVVGWFVNDLHRHPLPYVAFGWLARLVRWHPFVRHDGPVSIARAFRADDWRRLVRGAGLSEADVRVRWRFPFRLCVSRTRPPG